MKIIDNFVNLDLDISLKSKKTGTDQARSLSFKNSIMAGVMWKPIFIFIRN